MAAFDADGTLSADLDFTLMQDGEPLVSTLVPMLSGCLPVVRSKS